MPNSMPSSLPFSTEPLRVGCKDKIVRDYEKAKLITGKLLNSSHESQSCP